MLFPSESKMGKFWTAASVALSGHSSVSSSIRSGSFERLSNRSSDCSGSAHIPFDSPFSSRSSASGDVGAVEYVSVVDASDGLLMWNGGYPLVVGVEGEAAADARALGGEYGRSNRDVPMGEMSRFGIVVWMRSDLE